MMIYEFRELLPEGVKVSDDEYRIIEDVYMFYPATINKKDIAELYVKYGMPLIRNMYKRAVIAKALEEKRRAAECKSASYTSCLTYLEKGHNPEDLPDNIKEELHIE